MDLEVLAQVATRRVLPLCDPGVSLANAGQIANVVELWQKDGCDRNSLLRYVMAAGWATMWDCCRNLARMLSDQEVEVLSRRAQHVVRPEHVERYRLALAQSRPAKK